ncbi:hypothetical protein STCU_09922 [Strigomonas culicis]|uniref:Uncharacterized protein n=1 Tax=Strigomonas culicis TaxID=28005 RepID=S9TJU7_9TRYP|nr:hypothetical protein STCU_09922 [Strigomonas culicis]|eukprot:EPY18422.1 hypothetical protein STCU_09922 [Strigomonas culicis]
MSARDAQLPFVPLTMETPADNARELKSAAGVFCSEDDLSSTHSSPKQCRQERRRSCSAVSLSRSLLRSTAAAVAVVPASPYRNDHQPQDDASGVALTTCGQRPKPWQRGPAPPVLLHAAHHLPAVDVTATAEDDSGAAVSPLSDVATTVPWSDLLRAARGPPRCSGGVELVRTECGVTSGATSDARGSPYSEPREEHSPLCSLPVDADRPVCVNAHSGGVSRGTRASAALAVGNLADYSFGAFNKSVVAFSLCADNSIEEVSTARDMTEVELMSIFDTRDNSSGSHPLPLKDDKVPGVLQRLLILVSADNNSRDVSPTNFMAGRR